MADAPVTLATIDPSLVYLLGLHAAMRGEDVDAHDIFLQVRYPDPPALQVGTCLFPAETCPGIDEEVAAAWHAVVEWWDTTATDAECVTVLSAFMSYTDPDTVRQGIAFAKSTIGGVH